MVKLCIFVSALISFYFAVTAVLAEVPTCETSCGVVALIQSCQNGELRCTCDPQVLSEALECAKCTTYSGVQTPLISSFISGVCKLESAANMSSPGIVASRHFVLPREMPGDVNSSTSDGTTPVATITSVYTNETNASPTLGMPSLGVLGVVAGFSFLAVQL